MKKAAAAAAAAPPQVREQGRRRRRRLLETKGSVRLGSSSRGRRPGRASGMGALAADRGRNLPIRVQGRGVRERMRVQEQERECR